MTATSPRNAPGPDRATWSASAAYLYLLGLDGPGWAWEYLRRNTDYRLEARKWGQLGGRIAGPEQWGLAAFTDPSLDALRVEPAWLPALASALRLVRWDKANGTLRFDPWRLRGARTLVQFGDGLRLCLAVSKGRACVALASDLSIGDPLGYAIPATSRLRDSLHDVAAIHDSLASSDVAVVSRTRPGLQAAIGHLRSLQALDGLAAGASHRDIASTLWGRAAVRARWTSDGDLRAQTRYCIARGRRFVAGGYRSLLERRK